MTFKLLIIVISCIPLPSDQHFIWPLSMCVRADICNHTWIAECGMEKTTLEMRIFIDECDLYEYSCDTEKWYIIMKYASCFNAHGPVKSTCPTFPTCKKKRNYYRMGDENMEHARRMLLLQTPPMTPPELPKHMLHGKRRYTKNRRKGTTKTTKKTKTTTKTKTTFAKSVGKKGSYNSVEPTTTPLPPLIVLKKQVIVKNGRKVLRVFKGRSTT